MTTLKLEEEVMKLSVDEKLQLIDQMWKSMDEPGNPSPDWHGDVLTERRSRIESGEAEFLTLDEFEAGLAGRVNEIRNQRRRS